jgi:hypothetical protein
VRKSIQEKKKAGELPSGGQKARPGLLLLVFQ